MEEMDNKTKKAKKAVKAPAKVETMRSAATGVKKTAEIAKPKSLAKKKAAPRAAASGAVSAKVSQEAIAMLAHRYWAERGGTHGHDADDWLRAEQELRGKAS